MANEISGEEFVRLANNFYTQNNLVSDISRIALDSQLINYFAANNQKMQQNYKVAFCCICLNQPYWEFIQPMIEGAKKFFLPGHKVDYFLWSDIPPDFHTGVSLEEAIRKLQAYKDTNPNAYADGINDGISKGIELLQKEKYKKFGATIFPVQSEPWPYPTLMRYHYFLQQEEVLKDYDYIFFCDVDMQFVNIVGDEILGKGLTAALHPGYATRKEVWPPYEPNRHSASFINRPGMVINSDGKPRFMPMYFAGGFQGGTSKEWFKAMKVMKDLVDKDLSQNYVPIWNDETAWNKYLEKTPEDLIVLTPSYIYPDSLIKEYYEPVVWGCSYLPKLVTLTKKFSVSKEGGEEVQKMIGIK